MVGLGYLKRNSMKQSVVDFIVKELDILYRERKEELIDAETFFKHKGVLIQLAKEREKEQVEKIHSKNVWIQVEEKLPEFGKPVLILTDYGKMDVCYLRLENNRNIVWVNHMRPEHTNGNVIAWLNLPEQ